jgi:hypothetical protein
VRDDAVVTTDPTSEVFPLEIRAVAIGGIVEIAIGVNAERKPLEEIAAPLSPVTPKVREVLRRARRPASR